MLESVDQEYYSLFFKTIQFWLGLVVCFKSLNATYNGCLCHGLFLESKVSHNIKLVTLLQHQIVVQDNDSMSEKAESQHKWVFSCHLGETGRELFWRLFVWLSKNQFMLDCFGLNDVEESFVQVFYAFSICVVDLIRKNSSKNHQTWANTPVVIVLLKEIYGLQNLEERLTHGVYGVFAQFSRYGPCKKLNFCFHMKIEVQCVDF